VSTHTRSDDDNYKSNLLPSMRCKNGRVKKGKWTSILV